MKKDICCDRQETFKTEVKISNKDERFTGVEQSDQHCFT